jgi:hypothetical protein
MFDAASFQELFQLPTAQRRRLVEQWRVTEFGAKTICSQGQGDL